MGRQPFQFQNEPSRRAPLVPVTESADFRKFDHSAKVRGLNGAPLGSIFAERQFAQTRQSQTRSSQFAELSRSWLRCDFFSTVSRL